MRDFQKAVDDFSQTIKLKPNNVQAYYRRGFIYGNLHEYDKAVVYLNQAIKLNPNNAKYYAARTAAYLALKNQKEAAKDARRACEMGDCKLLKSLEKNELIYD